MYGSWCSLHPCRQIVLQVGDILQLQHEYSEECNATAMFLSMLSPVMAGLVVCGAFHVLVHGKMPARVMHRQGLKPYACKYAHRWYHKVAIKPCVQA